MYDTGFVAHTHIISYRIILYHIIVLTNSRLLSVVFCFGFVRGSTVEIRHAEMHDARVSAMLFGEAAMYDVLITARTPNLAKNWIVGQNVMGFQFYDTSVKSILSNVTFRNFSRPLGDYAIRYMDHSDHYTPQGINSVYQLRFEDVSFNGIVGILNCGPLCGGGHVTMSSKIYSVWDWDGSLTQTGQPMLLGSTQNWWNNNDPSCTFNSAWKVWQCAWQERKTIVYLQLHVPGLMDGCDKQKYGENLGGGSCTDQFANYTVGRVSHWGQDAGANGPGMNIEPWPGVSGIGNTGWHWRVNSTAYNIDGAPSYFRIGENFQMPKGTFVVLSIAYPKEANISVTLVARYWPATFQPPLKMATYAQVVNATEPARPYAAMGCTGTPYYGFACKSVGSVGPAWHFDRNLGILYIRVVNLPCYNPNQGLSQCDNLVYTKWGASVPGISNGFYYEVKANCTGCPIQSSLRGINYYHVPNVVPPAPFVTDWGPVRKSTPAPVPRARNAFQCPAPQMCPPGMAGSPGFCQDVNECAINNGGCAMNTLPITQCNNVGGGGGRTCGSPAGSCPTGWSGNGVTCEDTNECASGNGGCSTLVSCSNTVGGRTCSSCPGGYTGNGEYCTNINECALNNGGCSAGVTCTDQPGTYSCGGCPSGYTGVTGSDCVDINECLTTNGGCDTLQTCVNSGGSFSCSQCPTGYTTSGNTCTDINECGVSNGGCDPVSVCTNQPGGKSCGSCPSGYSGTGATSCIDINECATSNGGCDSRTSCTNEDGTYGCSACPTGFHSESNDGKTPCVENTQSDPCAGVVCQNGGSCQANNGLCACLQGFTGSVCQTSPVISSVALSSVSSTSAGTVKQVAWSSTGGVSTVIIKLYKVGQTIPVAFITESASNAANTFLWTLPPSLRLTSGAYTIKVVFSQYPSISGSSAEFTIDGCAWAPCANGGACAAATGACTCTSGYTGISCEHDLCGSITCQNGGVCSRDLSATAGAGVCSCPAGFTGNWCEAQTSTCSLVCGHGGTIDSGCAACTCAASGANAFWQGTNCNTCTRQCSNGGSPSVTCAAQCECPYKFSGLTCQDHSLCLQLRLAMSYETASANPTQFATSFKNDVAVALGLTSDRVSEVTATADGAGTVVHFCLASNVSRAVLETSQQALTAQLTAPTSALMAGDTTSQADTAFGVQVAPEPTAGGDAGGKGFLETAIEGNNLYYVIAGGVVLITLITIIVLAATKKACFARAAGTGTNAKAVELSHTPTPDSSTNNPPTPTRAGGADVGSGSSEYKPLASPAATTTTAAATTTSSVADAAAPSEWVEQVAEGGAIYYWNTKTGASSWEQPTGYVPSAKPSVVTAPPAPAPAPAAAASGSDWTEQISDGNRYYWNTKTGESSWTRPAELDAPSSSQSASAAPPARPARPPRPVRQ